ncbi:MAG: lipopolysaccharide kinase InaA family protein [Phycisphaerae bacterium]
MSAEYRAALRERGLEPLARVLELRESDPDQPWLQTLSKPDLGGRSRWRVELPGGERVVYLKRYARPKLREQWDRIWRQNAWHSRAWWEHHQARVLAELRIPANRGVGFVEQMRGQFERRSAVVLERTPGEACDRVWRRWVEAGDARTRGCARHDFARRLARFVAAFHGTGMCHRDLYLCHIFVEGPDSPDQAPRFALIDLARTHRPRWRRTRWILKDLSQVDASARQVGASRADRFRFLLAYLGLQRGAARARWFARRVARRSDRILRREARKLRPS